VPPTYTSTPAMLLTVGVKLWIAGAPTPPLGENVEVC